MACCDDPAEPTSGNCATTPADSASTTCPQCEYWNRDHQIDYRGADSKFVQSSQFAGDQAGFRLEANLASGNITVTSIFRWGTIASGITEAEKADTITKFKQQVAAWSGHYSMRITDPICGERTLPIRFRLLWSPDDSADSATHQVNLYRTYARAGVTGWHVDIGYDSDVTVDGAWTLAHEYGHTISLKDEYFYSGVTSANVVYKKSDGTTERVTLEPSSSNIMFTFGDRTYHPRFFYFTAIQAQELLRRESGRNVTCEIV